MSDYLHRHRLCSDATFIRSLWDRYDSQSDGSKVYFGLLSVLQRLITSNPGLLGVSTQMFGVGVSSTESASASMYNLDMGGVAGMVATAASATVSNVASLMSSGSGLSSATSSMKLQWYRSFNLIFLCIVLLSYI